MNRIISGIPVMGMLGCLVVGARPAASETLPASQACSRLSVAYGSDGTWINRYAAEEFARYVGEMTGQAPVVTQVVTPDTKGPVVLIGNRETNEGIAHLEAAGLVNVSDKLPEGDGFAIAGSKDGEREYLVLAARNVRATLYAVYDFLERCCGVGFFVDGERIPKRTIEEVAGAFRRAVPSGILIERPRFRNRFAHLWSGQLGVKYNHDSRWDFTEWRQFIDRSLRLKLNFTLIADLFLGMRDLIMADLPEMGYKPFYRGDYAPEYRREMMKKVFDYGRARGFRFVMWVDCNGFPEGRDPVKWGVPFLKHFIDVFGPMDMYMINFASESHDISKEERVRVMNSVLDRVRGIDPKGELWFETWVCSSLPLPDMPRDIHIFDNMAQGELYRKMDYYNGRAWNFLPMTGGGEDLFGWPSWFLRHGKDLAKDPLAEKLEGFGLYSEIVNFNDVVDTLIARLAWDPEGIELDSYLSDYALQRYGPQAGPAMAESLRLLCELLDHRREIFDGAGLLDDRYIFTVWPNYRWAKMFSFTNVSSRWRDYEPDQTWLRKMERSLEAALSVADKTAGNHLYDIYLAHLFEKYAIELYKYPLIQFYSAYSVGTKANREGDREKAAEAIERYREARKKIEAIYESLVGVFSTIRERSLAMDLDEIMAVPGTDQRLPEQTRAWVEVLNFNSVEMIKHVWSGEFATIADELDARLGHGETKLVKAVGAAWSETDAYVYDRVNPYRDGLDPVLEEKLKEIHEAWRSGKNFRVAIAPDPPSPVQAVKASLKHLGELDALNYPDMTTIEEIARNYPFPLRMRAATDSPKSDILEEGDQF